MRTMLLLVLVACNDQGLQVRDDVNGRNDVPEIAITPDVLDFGSRGPEEAAEQVFTITNEGTEQSVLFVHEIEFAFGDELGYALVDYDPEESISLFRGESWAVTVRFQPLLPGTLEGRVLVRSSDDYDSEVPVSLMAEGLMPYVQIDPNPLDFGEVLVECTARSHFTVSNIGNMRLDISGLASEGLGFVLLDDERPALPAYLEQGDSVPVGIEFAPLTEAVFHGNLVVTSNDPRGVVRSPQRGDGIFAGYYEEEFTVPPQGPVDLVFAVDQSSSMTDDQVALAAKAETFAALLTATTEDWRVMVVTRDDGCYSGLMTPSTPDFATAFAAAVQDGTEGFFSEKLLYLGDLAVRNTAAGKCNEDFALRSDALLHMVFITDEDEQSPERYDFYVDSVRDFKGASHLVKMSAIAGDVPGGCTAEGNSAAPGTRYVNAVNATYGTFLSLCSDWPSEIDALARVGITQTDFPLTHPADASTITVEVNGMARTSGWSYYGDGNKVVFTENPPQSNDHVRVSYDIPFVCP